MPAQPELHVVRETILTCDRCHETVDANTDTLHKFCAGSQGNRASSTYIDTRFEVELCRECAERTGLFPLVKLKDANPPVEVDEPLDALVRLVEILQERGILPYAE